MASLEDGGSEVIESIQAFSSGFSRAIQKLIHCFTDMGATNQAPYISFTINWVTGVGALVPGISISTWDTTSIRIVHPWATGCVPYLYMYNCTTLCFSMFQRKVVSKVQMVRVREEKYSQCFKLR